MEWAGSRKDRGKRQTTQTPGSRDVVNWVPVEKEPNRTPKFMVYATGQMTVV